MEEDILLYYAGFDDIGSLQGCDCSTHNISYEKQKAISKELQEKFEWYNSHDIIR